MAKDSLSTQETAPEPGTDPNWPRDVDARLKRLGKATMEATVELGRTRLPLEDVLNSEPGSVVELEKRTGSPVEVLVNGSLFGKGEIVVIGDNLAIRITDLPSPE